MEAALTRFRVMAYIVGVLLLVLVFVAVLTFSLASSSLNRSRPMVRRIARTSFSGANLARLFSSGISMLMERRSAYLPASAISASSASGMVF